MSAFLWAALGVLGGLGMAAIGDLVSEEIRDRLDHLPHAILRLAALRLSPALRDDVYNDEWMPELTYILRGDEARPITRLYHRPASPSAFSPPPGGSPEGSPVLLSWHLKPS